MSYEVCDETIRDFGISNNGRASSNIYQVHQKELENYNSNELDSSDDVLNKSNDLVIPIYYTKNIKKYAKQIDLLDVVDGTNNKEHLVYIKDLYKLMGTDGKHRTYFCKHCVQPCSSEEK